MKDGIRKYILRKEQGLIDGSISEPAARPNINQQKITERVTSGICAMFPVMSPLVNMERAVVVKPELSTNY
jgi:hypothetical protein